MSDLSTKHCESCEGIGTALNREQILHLMPQLHENWQLDNQHHYLVRKLQFDNFYETMSFVNAVAFIANIENHHPDLELGYNYCTIKYMTHALHGLSHNDFICAAKVDQLLLS